MASASNYSRDSIDVLVQIMEKKLDDLSPLYGDDHCIYRVNQTFQKINPDAYNPELVSIGPFHHKQESLSAMEEHKLHYLKTFILEQWEGKQHLQDYYQHMRNLLDETRKCYAEAIKLDASDDASDDDAFVEMMLLDGLFIILLFQKCQEQKFDGRPKGVLLNHLWSNIASLMHDIFLLENQLPMRVLDDLFNLTKTHAPGFSSYRNITELSLQIFNGLIMDKSYDDPNDEYLATPKPKHLLDLLGKTLHPSLRSSPVGFLVLSQIKTSTSVPCVTELTQAGVKFEKGTDSDRLLDIKFKNGIMTIPPIIIEDLTETLLRNLIAYEQCSYQRDYMISYAFFMGCLIKSEEDVRILCQQGIIKNGLGNNGEVCDLFNRLCNGVTLESFYYSKICYDVNKYSDSNCHRWMAILRREYFQTPWTIIAFVAAVILLSLTIIQTVNSF